ncbi:MAG: hypothetical protein DMG05_09990 [Acidobacteria bacterium]|nr:MAG: hypothetical protein DMG05_09990 [Acidobacteriota bacterium]
MRVCKPSRISAKGRRAFLKAFGATSFLPSFLAGCGQSARPNGNEKRPSASIDAEIQALTDVIRSRYGTKLTDQQLQEIHSEIESNLKNREQLRLVRLKNSDEPDVIFRATI